MTTMQQETTVMTPSQAVTPDPPDAAHAGRREPHTFHVDPERLEWGTWDHRLDKRVGEGDIAASYSADRIAEGKPVRTPFQWQGKSWISVGGSVCHGNHSAEAYSVVDPRSFIGPTTTYAEKTHDCEAARNDPNGFYHGMTVKQAGQTFVLCGPPATFLPGEKQQLGLFDF